MSVVLSQTNTSQVLFSSQLVSSYVDASQLAKVIYLHILSVIVQRSSDTNFTVVASRPRNVLVLASSRECELGHTPH
jgi:hypothetical protein